MRVLILWADDKSSNLGVRALAEGSAALVRRVWPAATTAFQSYGPGDAPMRVGDQRALLREWATNRRGLRSWLEGFDLVVDTRAGDSFADIYGMRRLTTMSLLAEFARRAHVPVVMGPQTIGPFESRRGALVGRYTLSRSTAVMARDSVSAEHAARIGRPVDVLATDVVFALDVPIVPKRFDVLLNVSGLLWRGDAHVDSAAYRQTVRRLYNGLVAAGRTVGLLAHVIDSDDADNDVPAIRSFVAEGGVDAEIVVPTSLTDVREIVAAAELVIGSRMHACLNALSVGTPAVPLAYSRKFAPLLDDLGWAHNVDLRSDADPAAHALEIVGDDALAESAQLVAKTAQDLLAPAEHILRGSLR